MPITTRPRFDGRSFGTNLTEACETARRATEWLLELDDPNDALAGSAPYLRLLGTVVCGGYMAKSGLNASAKAANGADGNAADAEFYEAKLVSSVFFGEQILPTANGLLGAVRAGAADLFALTPDNSADAGKPRVRHPQFRPSQPQVGSAGKKWPLALVSSPCTCPLLLLPSPPRRATRSTLDR